MGEFLGGMLAGALLATVLWFGIISNNEYDSNQQTANCIAAANGTNNPNAYQYCLHFYQPQLYYMIRQATPFTGAPPNDR